MGFWKYAQDDPGYLAIVDPDGTEHTRRRRARPRATRSSHALRALGLKHGRRGRGGAAERRRSPFTVYLAALQTGLYYVPINYRLSRARDRVHPRRTPRRRRSSATSASPTLVERGRRRGRHPGRGAGSRTARSRASARSTSSSTRSRRRCPRTAPPARRCTTRRARTGKPKGVKRALADLDPDVERRALHVLASALRHPAAATATCTSARRRTTTPRSRRSRATRCT